MEPLIREIYKQQNVFDGMVATLKQRLIRGDFVIYSHVDADQFLQENNQKKQFQITLPNNKIKPPQEEDQSLTIDLELLELDGLIKRQQDHVAQFALKQKSIMNKITIRGCFFCKQCPNRFQTRKSLIRHVTKIH